MQEIGQVESALREQGIWIVADDLTGACDSGVAFVGCGRPVRVVLESGALDANAVFRSNPDAVLAFTTESRDLREEQAMERVRGTIVRAVEAGAGMFLKKIDSAGRGHIGAETLAAMSACEAAIALVAPAFPEAGRTVDAGLLHIRDAAGQHTVIPLRSFFPAISPEQIGVLHAAPVADLHGEVEAAIACGTRVLLCDAATQAELQQIAAAGLRAGQHILWVGSAGLAHALANTVRRASQVQSQLPNRREGRTLLFVGTDHPVTRLQVSQLGSASDHALRQIVWDEGSPRWIRAAFDEAPVGALVLTGGDTAACVLRALEAGSIVLAGELLPGIPWGIIEGGCADGCVVVTKSGGFGSRDALVSIIEFCNRRVCEPA